MPRQLQAKTKITREKQRKMSVSPFMILGVALAIGVAFLGFNLKALSKTIHQEMGVVVGEAVAHDPPPASGEKAIAAAEVQRSALEKEEPAQDTAPESGGGGDGPTYQIIFSTGCSAFQDWQSYVLFFHAAKILKQASPPKSAMSNTHVTRIASGCTDSDAEIMKKYHKEQIEIMTPLDNFHLHLTPDYSRQHGGTKSYKYFNKPFGTKHWMENALGYKKGDAINTHDDHIVILLDPDQIILKPFTTDFGKHPEAWRRKNSLPIWDKVTHGQPFAQQYGFHNQWHDKTNIDAIAKKEELPSPVQSMSRPMITENFAAGPPYIATGHDFYLIADKWAEFGVGVHEQYPNLLAEMFAYCLAAAHLNLPHQIAQSFMVSDVGTGGLEGWKHYIDKYSEMDVCTDGAIPQDELPFVLHYCQRYWLGKWFIGKYKLPSDFISCKSPLLKEPPNDIATKYDFAIQPGSGDRKTLNKDHIKRNAFMICRFIPALNEAARFYKKNHCKDDPPNMEETLIFHKNMEIE